MYALSGQQASDVTFDDVSGVRPVTMAAAADPTWLPAQSPDEKGILYFINVCSDL